MASNLRHSKAKVLRTGCLHFLYHSLFKCLLVIFKWVSQVISFKAETHECSLAYDRYSIRQGKQHVQGTKEDGLSDRDSKKREEALYFSRKIAPFILPAPSELPIGLLLLESSKAHFRK